MRRNWRQVSLLRRSNVTKVKPTVPTARLPALSGYVKLFPWLSNGLRMLLTRTIALRVSCRSSSDTTNVVKYKYFMILSIDMRALLCIIFGAFSLLLGQAYKSYTSDSEAKRSAIAKADFRDLNVTIAQHQFLLQNGLSPGARVHIRGSDGFRNLTLRWEKYKKPDFAIAVAVGTEDDVVQTVCATY